MNTKILEIKFQDLKFEIPYIEIIGKKPGPTAFISGGVHGNEINGIALVKNIIKTAKREKWQDILKGKLFIFPVINTSGFKAGTRYVPEDCKDLNRQFGYKRFTNISKFIAYTLTEQIFKKCDFGIDCHDSGGNIIHTPHTRIHKTQDAVSSTYDLARIFGTKIILERKGNPHMMAVALNQLYATPVITLEIGGNQTLYPSFIKKGLQGIKNVLSIYDMIDSPIKIPAKQFVLYARSGIKTKYSGILKLKIKSGQVVHAGDKVGELYNPLTQKNYILYAPMCGIIFSKRTRNQVIEGETLYSILEYKQCHIKRTTLNTFKELDNYTVNKIYL